MTTISRDLIKFIDYIKENYVWIDKGWIRKYASRFDPNNFKTVEELYDEWYKDNNSDLAGI